MAKRRNYREIDHDKYCDENGESVNIVWELTSARVSVKTIRTICSEAVHSKASKLILVSIGKLTTFAAQETKNMRDIQIETWQLSDLSINPELHELVPPHEILNSKRTKQRGIKSPSELPKMQGTDMMARFLGAKKGDVIEIKRTHPEGHYYIVHRVVV